MVQFGGIPTVVFFCYLQYAVAGIGKSHQSFVDPLGQVWWGYQLAFNRNCLCHGSIILI
jgi:hypothetical protein